MGPGGRCASASRITDNKVVVFPPDRRIKEAKSNGLGSAGCCQHFHHLQDHQIAMEPRLRRLKVRILAAETELDAERIQYAEYNKYA